jgi:Flp pilus assembly protein protease CpaA
VLVSFPAKRAFPRFGSLSSLRYLPCFSDKGESGKESMRGKHGMQVPFHPCSLFAWIYLGVLMSLLGVASYTDLGRMVVPKSVTLSALGLGFVFNLLRGWMLGAKGLTTWVLGEGGAFLGAVDGLLFALAGFALGFALFFAMWILGICGGGDVKLFAALGAWVGPYLAVCVLSVTLVVVFALVFLGVVFKLVRGQGMKVFRTANRSRQAGKNEARPRRRVLGFSLPLTVATALVLLWAFRADFRFIAAPAMTTAGVANHAH